VVEKKNEVCWFPIPAKRQIYVELLLRDVVPIGMPPSRVIMPERPEVVTLPKESLSKLELITETL